MLMRRLKIRKVNELVNLGSVIDNAKINEEYDLNGIEWVKNRGGNGV